MIIKFYHKTQHKEKNKYYMEKLKPWSTFAYWPGAKNPKQLCVFGLLAAELWAKINQKMFLFRRQVIPRI